MYREPIVRESHDAVDGDALLADLCVHSMRHQVINHAKSEVLTRLVGHIAIAM